MRRGLPSASWTSSALRVRKGVEYREGCTHYLIPPLLMARKADVMDLEGPPRKREAVDVEQIGSPQKKSEGLSIEDIKGLLASHGQEMLKAQKEDIGMAVQNAVARSEKRTLGALEDIKKGLMQECERTRLEVTELAKEQKSMRSVQSDLLARVAKLETRPASSGSTTASDGDRRPALVFGGWAPTARRKVVLGDLQALLRDVAAEEYLDEPPWTPGPRRGVALSGFQVRAHETEEDMKARMVEVMNLVNRAAVPRLSSVEYYFKRPGTTRGRLPRKQNQASAALAAAGDGQRRHRLQRGQRLER